MLAKTSMTVTALKILGPGKSSLVKRERDKQHKMKKLHETATHETYKIERKNPATPAQRTTRP